METTFLQTLPMVRALVLLLLVAFTVSESQEERKLSARAFDIKDKQLVFTESRSRFYTQDQITHTQVKYIDGKGGLVAKKTLKYTTQRYAPQLEVEQKTLGYRLVAIPVGNKMEITLTEEGKTKKKSISLPPNPVMDEGIHLLVKDNLPKLLSGQELFFNLMIPERFTWAKFQVSKVGQKSSKFGEILMMEMRPANELLAFLVGTIELEYSLEKEELTTYRGISDIKDLEGENHRVYMDFDS